MSRKRKKKTFLRLIALTASIYAVLLQSFIAFAAQASTKNVDDAQSTTETSQQQKNLSSQEDLQILACTNAKLFISNLTKFNRANIHYTNVSKFEDGESLVKINDAKALQGKKVLVVQSISRNVNDAFMELMFTMNTVHSLGAKEIYLLVLYAGYSRQDRVEVEKISEAFSAKVIADLLSQSYVTKIFTVKLHSPQIQGFFNVPGIDLNTDKFFIEKIKQDYNPRDVVLIAPDTGAAKSVVPIAKEIHADFGVAIKYRPRAGENEILSLTGNSVKNKTCIIIDDMVDSAGTLCNVAEKVSQAGAKNVIAYMTHPVLSKKSIDRINNSCITELYISDTIDSKEKISSCKKIKVLSIGNWCIQKVMELIN